MITRQRKAVSPLIASVFLVVFTIGISAVLVDWLNTFTKDTTDDVSISSRSVINCIKVDISIDNVYLEVNSTGDDIISALVINKGPKVNIVSAYVYSTDGSSCTLSGSTQTISKGNSQTRINDTGCDIFAGNSSCPDFLMVKIITDCGATAVFRAPQEPVCVAI